MTDCVISEISKTAAVAANPPTQPTEVTQINWATFRINSTKFYVPVVTLSTNDNTKLLENLKPGFKRTSFWNKKSSELTTQPEKNNPHNMIDPTFYFFFHPN